jgi:DNA-directed RNA polymerase specialized sigma24 family protein
MTGIRKKAWEEKIPPPCANRPEHPLFRGMVEQHYRLIWWVDRKLRKWLDPKDCERWPTGYFNGFILDVLNRLLYTWDPTRSRIAGYLYFLARRHVIEEFLQYESETWHMFWDRMTAYPGYKWEVNTEYTYREAQYYLYHIPEAEAETEWTWNVINYFGRPADAVEFLLEGLSVRERSVILRRFICGDTLATIGRDEDVSKEYIRQIQERALNKIRRRVRLSGQFRDFMENELGKPLPEVRESRDSLENGLDRPLPTVKKKSKPQEFTPTVKSMEFVRRLEEAERSFWNSRNSPSRVMVFE